MIKRDRICIAILWTVVPGWILWIGVSAIVAGFAWPVAGFAASSMLALLWKGGIR